MSTIPNQEYSNWIVSLKSSIKQRQIKAAIVDCGDFFEEPVHDTNFLTWMYGGMHDKGERDRNTKVIRRSNFFRRYLNLKTGDY